MRQSWSPVRDSPTESVKRDDRSEDTCWYLRPGSETPRNLKEAKRIERVGDPVPAADRSGLNTQQDHDFSDSS